MRLIHPANPFELVDSPWGEIETWRAAALATGTMGCLTEVYSQVRNDAAELTAREKEHASRADAELSLARSVVAKLDALNTRLTRLEEAQQAREAKAREDQRQLEDPEDIELPPGLGEIGEISELPLDNPADTSDDTPPPDGHLHSVGPSHDKHKEQLAELEKDDATDEGPGDLPPELLEGAPAPSGDYPVNSPAELSHPPTSTPRQTVAPSFW
jgi:hypothetical protein